MSQTFEPQILVTSSAQNFPDAKKGDRQQGLPELPWQVWPPDVLRKPPGSSLRESQWRPHRRARAEMIAGRKLAIVPILRAGLGMVDGMLTLIPAAKVGHIGLYRDEETARPIEYFCKLPCDISEREVIVVIPCWPPAAAPSMPFP